LKALPKEVLRRARGVRLMIFDVDGVLTDGTLWYGPRGEELKAFSAHDGHGIKLLAAAGVAIALLSGRRSKAVALRARELGITKVFQGVDDKLAVFQKLLKSEKLTPESAGFMGDELVDLPVLERCGFACAPREAPQAVRGRVHYVTAAPAGRGAVRELCDLLVAGR
jgi:3-deoxy-D-manno-octulosonate 8-phosphate phosphatase (KDO 8-P phosphatase)